MHIIKLSAMTATVLAAIAFAPQFTAAADLQPGKGWDSFQARDGQSVSSDSYLGTSMGSAPGQGYDTNHARDGAPIEGGYQGTSMGSAGQGYDTF
ncbi:MAG TPA: hypothetical protein VEP67_06165, partial [Thiobacillaceae bacterium]|nr:hypothetical protein [Thiobacillaceae bacterium]